MKDGSMEVEIKYDGQTVMTLAVISIVESASRNGVLQHVIECDRTEWLERWQEEKKAAYEEGQKRVVEILRGNS